MIVELCRKHNQTVISSESLKGWSREILAKKGFLRFVRFAHCGRNNFFSTKHDDYVKKIGNDRKNGFLSFSCESDDGIIEYKKLLTFKKVMERICCHSCAGRSPENAIK